MLPFIVALILIGLLAGGLPAPVFAAEPDFAVAAFPSSQTVNPGGTTSFLITVTYLDGFDSPVTLSATGLPDGASASFDPNPVIPTGNSMMAIATSTDTPVGSYSIDILGISGALTRSASTAITVDFGLLPMQYGTFAGQVTDADTGSALADARVGAFEIWFGTFLLRLPQTLMATILLPVSPWRTAMPPGNGCWCSRLRGIPELLS